jgi:exodeoxyribonuclease V alpha subunit
MGVAGWNRIIEQRLGPGTSNQWYLGRPIIVSENDKATGLFNGDVAVIGQDNSGRVAYFNSDSAKPGLPVTRLPDVETVHALTIHKSQGSEYDHVIVVLPEGESRILVRELLYTSVTRARSRLTLIGRSPVVEYAVFTKVERATGLAQRIPAR